MTWRPEWEEQPRRGFGFGRGPHGWGVTKTLVAACVVVTLANMLSYGVFTRVDHAGAPQPAIPIDAWFGLSIRNAFWIYPWFSYVFVHDAMDVKHILFNGVMLWFLGVELEQRLGRGRFLTLFFGAALVGAAAHVVIQGAFLSSSSPLIGASGGIFGLLFFIARETPDRPFVFWIVPIPAKVLAGLYVILELFPLITGPFRSDGVAHLCHLGGAAFGLAYFRWQFDAFDGFAAAFASRRARGTIQRREEAVESDVEMDRLLRKIHESGMASLDDRERAFLDERSRRLRGGRS